MLYYQCVAGLVTLLSNKEYWIKGTGHIGQNLLNMYTVYISLADTNNMHDAMLLKSLSACY